MEKEPQAIPECASPEALDVFKASNGGVKRAFITIFFLPCLVALINRGGRNVFNSKAWHGSVLCLPSPASSWDALSDEVTTRRAV